MWARVVEFMLACWLAISPFVFRYSSDELFFWWNDLTTSSLLAIFALLSYAKNLRRLHLCNLIIAIYLITLCYVMKGHSFEYALQNYMILGLLLLMISIIPSQASRPPKKWRDFYSN